MKRCFTMHPSLAMPLLLVVASLACVDSTPMPPRFVVPDVLARVADRPPPQPIESASLARAEPERAAQTLAAPLVVEPSPTPPERGVRLASASGVVYVPRALHLDGGAFDLVIHFHGDTRASEDQLDRAGIRAVLLTVNLGTSSGAYRARFQDASALGIVLGSVESTLAKRLGVTAPHVRRVALSAWSAGYAAVLRILGQPASADRLDAVLLEDGPHAMFKDAIRRVVDESRLTPLVDFSRRAMSGGALLAWSHSAIRTSDYASTTETTSWVLAALALDRAPASAEDGHLRLTSIADSGAFHLRGYAGDTATDHCDHLLSLSRTLLPMLRQRWGG